MTKPDDLPAADTIIDYGDGSFGPLFLHWALPDSNAYDYAREAGFETRFVFMSEELEPEHELCVDYFEYGSAADEILPKWQPLDLGHGWKLVARDDSEDGPRAIFIRPLPKE